ncbi:uncharacterized protein LOC141640382 [Silene latifolia]|uniref:uncharacterized protein LOC141640382 n=1 Tax=Silene latifolia TaxID=37657 RepID=UPI003D76B90B
MVLTQEGDCGWAAERISLWERLRAISINLNLPWICMGDFNISLSQDERVGFIPHDRDITEFRDCIDACSLVDHPYTGGFPSSTVTFLAPGISDHASILLSITSNFTAPKSFRYLNCWTLSPDFTESVTKGWTYNGHGNRIFTLFSKLRGLRVQLRQIHTNEFSSLTARVSAAKEQLVQCQLALLSSPQSQLLLTKEK